MILIGKAIKMNFRSAACLLLILLCFNAIDDVCGQEAYVPKRALPKLVSDGPIPKSIVQLLDALGAVKRPHIEVDDATKEDIAGFVEETLNGVHVNGLRVDRPILFSHPTKTSFKSSGDSSLKVICDLIERAGLHFSIRENHTFVFEPVGNGDVEYEVAFACYADGQETFTVSKR